MAQNVNKVIYNNQTLIDLTSDTVTESDLALGVTAHDKSGNIITGTSTKDSDTTDATATKAEILSGQTAYVNKVKLTGTMANNGGIAKTISTVGQEVSIPVGYHDGSGKVSIATAEQSKIVASNIREGVTILGVTGTMSGSESEHPQADKSVTPSTAQQIVTPDEGFTCLSQVTVEKIPYEESSNGAGGITVSIACSK